ncbi:MAG: long-chain-fatty-acid--CoA ligase [Planctomycetota bacterium]
MHIRSLMARAASLFPDRVAVVEAGWSCTYAELGDRVARVAGALTGAGVGAHDRVAIVGHNHAAFLELYFACAHLDAVAVPINVRLHPREMRAILCDAGIAVLAGDVALDEVLATAIEDTSVGTVLWFGPPSIDGRGPALRSGVETLTYRTAVACAPVAPGSGRGGDQLAHLYYTSGTTGAPKGVMLTHRNVCAHAMMTVAELCLAGTDTWAHIAPMFHLADAWATFAITAVGGRHAMLPRFTAEAALALLARERVTVTNLVPTMLNLMVKHESLPRFDLSHMRLVLSGGASIAPAVVRQVDAAFGGQYVQTYGMTETSPFLTMSLLKEEMRAWPEAAQLAMRGKTGRPVLGVDLRVVDGDGRRVRDDEREVGEIQVRGETVTPGYWQQADATAQAFTADGYLRTGDLAVLDSEGFVTIVDRAKDVVITGGEKVYSTEVENALYLHPAVLEAAAFGQADPIWGERVVAAVVLRAGAQADADELVAFCRQRLAGFKVPREIRFRDSLPRTGSGKIAKRFLRDGP